MQESQIFTAPYVCPRTHAPLLPDGDVLRTAKRDILYPVHADIPRFLRFDAAENQATEARLERLNAIARESGWESALTAVYGDDPAMIRYVTMADRASFIDLLPMTKQSDVLEIGPGLGQFSALIARRANSVCALEIVSGQAEFAAQRCGQQGITNVAFAVGGDDCRLPYKDSAFNVVVLNLVFEWCAWRCSDEQFNDVQRRLLDEISRVLRPGGALYLTTKNRYGLGILLGERDEHCHEIRFGSALPRWLARFLMKLKGHSRPLGMLYSHNKLKAMLHEAGFEKADSFWATPEMRYPTHYVPTDAAAIRAARQRPGFVQGETRRSKLFMQFIPAALVKHFTPGLAFLATKGP